MGLLKKSRLVCKTVMLLILGILLIANLNAEITISGVNSQYNLGEELGFQISLSMPQPGYLDVYLNCNGIENNIYHDVPESGRISLTRKLTQAYVGAALGDCQIKASYANETSNSRVFKISNTILVELETNTSSIMAGKDFYLRGKAIKENGENVGETYRAFMEIKLDNLEKRVESISNGVLEATITIPEETAAGSHALSLEVYERDNQDNIINSGIATAKIEVIQKPAKVEVAIDKTSLIPGEEISIIPLIYDMAGNLMNKKVLLQFKDALGNVLLEGYYAVGEEIKYAVKESQAPGDYKILIQEQELNSQKGLQITELKKISSKLENSTLVIKNIGNVYYDEIAELEIGAKKLLKNIKLAIGEEIRYSLSAPDGNYDLNIKSGESTETYSQIPLTGNAISARELSESWKYIFSQYTIVWIFILVVLVALVVLVIRKYWKNKKFHFSPYDRGKSSRFREEIKKKGGVSVVKPQVIENKIDETILSKDVKKAEQVLVLHGTDTPVGVVALKIKNGASGISKDNINRALEYAYSKKGVSYLAGNFIILIFSPLLTENKSNEKTAIDVARDIDTFLKEHNRKFRNDKIDYGIGVNCGSLVNALDMNRKILQFANMGRTISNAKRIAEMSEQEIYLSKEIHEKTLSDVKVDKVDLKKTFGKDVYTIKRIVDSEQSKKFIDNFMKRN